MPSSGYVPWSFPPLLPCSLPSSLNPSSARFLPSAVHASSRPFLTRSLHQPSLPHPSLPPLTLSVCLASSLPTSLPLLSPSLSPFLVPSFPTISLLPPSSCLPPSLLPSLPPSLPPSLIRPSLPPSLPPSDPPLVPSLLPPTLPCSLPPIFLYPKHCWWVSRQRLTKRVLNTRPPCDRTLIGPTSVVWSLAILEGYTVRRPTLAIHDTETMAYS